MISFISQTLGTALGLILAVALLAGVGYMFYDPIVEAPRYC